MFDRGGWRRPERSEDGEEPKRPAPRFAPKVLAAIHGKPLKDFSKDRVFEDTRPVSSGISKPKRTPKPKTELKPKQPPKESKPMKESTVAAPQHVRQVTSELPSTTNYDLFRFLPMNRPVDRAFVRRLAREIEKNNLLHLNPMVVNSDFGVIEGQHRLEAARQLGVPIFYILNDKVTEDDIASMNSHKKNWALAEYMHFFEAKGLRPYVEFMTFYRERAASLPLAVVLTIATEKGSLKGNYKDGTLDISNLKLAGEVIGYLPDYQPYTAFYNSTKFIEALAFIVRTGLYDHDHMMSRLQLTGALQPQPQVKTWIIELQRTYQYKVREDKLVTFLKRI